MVKKVTELMNYSKKFNIIEERIGDVKRHCADINETKELIGWTAKTDFEKGIEETIEWYKSHPEAFKPSIV